MFLSMAGRRRLGVDRIRRPRQTVSRTPHPFPSAIVPVLGVLRAADTTHANEEDAEIIVGTNYYKQRQGERHLP